jgi:hypothetical protein
LITMAMRYSDEVLTDAARTAKSSLPLGRPDLGSGARLLPGFPRAATVLRRGCPVDPRAVQINQLR